MSEIGVLPTAERFSPPDPMAHDLGLGSDFSEISTPGSESSVMRFDEPRGYRRRLAVQQTGRLSVGFFSVACDSSHLLDL